MIGFLDSASDGDIGFQLHLIDNKDRSLIIDALRRTTNGFIDEIRTLEMEGHSIHTCLNPCLSYTVLDSYGINDLEEAVLTMVVTSGYLTATPLDLHMTDIQIPNKEALLSVYQVIKKNMGKRSIRHLNCTPEQFWMIFFVHHQYIC